MDKGGWKTADIPNYLHRVGRTGRFGTDGLALSLVGNETDDTLLDAIQDHYNIEIKTIKGIDELKGILQEMRPGGDDA